MRVSLTQGLIVGVLLGAWLLLAWGTRPEIAPSPCEPASGPVLFPDIPESSGLAVSRRNPALLWSHNDSGSAAVLFALDTAGTQHGRVRVPVSTRDWEDVSVGPCPSGDCLYVADIGDNRRQRPSVTIYRVPEPAPGDETTAPPEVFSVTYADGPHNAEAMFVVGADIFIVTRDRIGGLYRATLAGSHELTFQRIGELGLSGVTDAEASPDQKSVVVRTEHEAVLYRMDDRMLGASYLRIPLDGLKEPQGEGVALDGNMLYLSSEGRPWNRGGQLLGLRCSWSE
jgi:hypothetical protein